MIINILRILSKNKTKDKIFFEKAEILRSKYKIINDLNVNNINWNKRNNNKNYTKNFNKKINNDYYCHIYRIKGHSSDHCKYNSLIKKNNKSDDYNDKNYKIDNNKNNNHLGHYYNNIKIFVIKHTKNHKDKNFHQYIITKLKKKLFYSSSNNATKLMELVHFNVVGILKTSYNDFNCYVTFLDDFSRKIWVYLIKYKSDVPNIFIKFCKFISNTTFYSIIILKSDNGKEYINRSLKNYLGDNGINFLHSIFGNRQQNVSAERLNQTLNRYLSILLKTTKLPL